MEKNKDINRSAKIKVNSKNDSKIINNNFNKRKYNTNDKVVYNKYVVSTNKNYNNKSVKRAKYVGSTKFYNKYKYFKNYKNSVQRKYKYTRTQWLRIKRKRNFRDVIKLKFLLSKKNWFKKYRLFSSLFKKMFFNNASATADKIKKYPFIQKLFYFNQILRKNSYIYYKKRKKIQNKYKTCYINIKKTLNNLFVVVFNKKNEIKKSWSCGRLGFKNSKKDTPFVCSEIGRKCAEFVKHLKVHKIKILLKSQLCKYTKTFLRSFIDCCNQNPKFPKHDNFKFLKHYKRIKIRIIHAVSIAHNGCRKKKIRRILSLNWKT